MARKLSFLLDEKPFEFALHKVDRGKLYGRTETITVDAQERLLNKGYLDEWGSVVIASTGMGYIDGQKNWCSKADLAPLDEQGNVLTVFPSSFDAPVALEASVSLESFCEHEITAVYILKGFEEEVFYQALTQVESWYTFPFNYRASYDPKTAFLNPAAGKVFLMIGTKAELVFLDKPQRVEIEEFEEEELDFSMM